MRGRREPPGAVDYTRSDTIDPNTNRVTNSGFSYDQAGNTTATSGGYSYSYDGASRVTQVARSAFNYQVNFSYNAGPGRVRLTSGSATVYYVNQADGRKLAEKQADGTWRDYIYLGARLIAEVTSTATSYHHPDRLSIRVLSDASGNSIGQQQTAPFGEVVVDTTGATKFKFTTYERDTNGFFGDYAIHRQYASTLARFGRPDPYLGSMNISDPQSLNRYNYYNYVGNAPITMPTRWGWTDFIVLAAASAEIALSCRNYSRA